MGPLNGRSAIALASCTYGSAFTRSCSASKNWSRRSKSPADGSSSIDTRPFASNPSGVRSSRCTLRRNSAAPASRTTAAVTCQPTTRRCIRRSRGCIAVRAPELRMRPARIRPTNEAGSTPVSAPVRTASPRVTTSTEGAAALALASRGTSTGASRTSVRTSRLARHQPAIVPPDASIALSKRLRRTSRWRDAPSAS
jgi:hypothetical protein